MSTSTERRYSRLSRLGLGLMLVALPACGLSNYEALMREAQQSDEHFRNEQKYLDEPAQIATEKDKQGRDVPLANIFFRPPKGITAKPEAESRQGLWHYPAAQKGGGDFSFVELEFTTDNPDFATNVWGKYQAEEIVQVPPRDPPLPFDSWEFNDAQHRYSINFSKDGKTRVAVVYAFAKGQRNALRPTIDLSLQSLAVDQQAVLARQKYSQKSPWQLKPTPAP